MHKEKLLNIEEQSPLWFAVIIVICYGFYKVLSPEMQSFAMRAGALAADRGHVFIEGRPLGSIATLFTHVLLHGSWAHVLVNAGLILAFGTITIRAVKNRGIPIARRFQRGSVVFLVVVLIGAFVGGVFQWGVWIASSSSGIAVGASTSGTALFATSAWALGGRSRLLAFGIIVVTYDMVILWTSGLTTGLGNPAWAGHLGGYLAGALIAPGLIKPSSVGVGVNSSR